MQTEVSCEQCRDVLMDALDAVPNPLQRQMADAHLEHCALCQNFMQQVWQTQALASRWADQRVPNWGRRGLFFESPGWLPSLQWVSTAASVLVLVLVLGQVRISTTDGLAFEFGPQDYINNEALKTELASLQQQQQQLLQLKVDQLTSQQLASNQLLMRTVLDMSRAERREEFSSLLTAWDGVQDQRSYQTNESIRVLLASQIEDKRDIQQINRLLKQASLEGTNL